MLSSYLFTEFVAFTSRINEMSDSEDDYMSEAILGKVEDVKPGIAKNREHKRQLDILKREYKPTLPKHELEAQRRQEALSKPVSHENKGFALLAKMGYKPGMSLGKPKDSEEGRRTEPITLQIKFGRKGLGHETQEKEDQVERCEAHMKYMSERAKQSDELAEDFRKRKRFDVNVRSVVGDIMKSRKACQDLDLREGKSAPDMAHLWPVIREVVETEEFEYMTKRTRHEQVNKEYTFKYSSGVVAPEEPDLYSLEMDDLIFRLATVTDYLRSHHFYCVWCGCAFVSEEDLSSNCPGPRRDCHDEDNLD
ncbi:unnamed protein product [Bursaphelenchus xylophilus]|uniref:G patch domain-containing protein 11 n=1 Tax=Bursaphelenchus xylophilus TaxID=6326 RepID=A0A1I7RRU3_BURXY|nr:unnamed protein product [Bursaphelenchus xylophilus]CAG9123472.1 unnamed protein product [Bursaphelenchus xylophilus]